MCAVDNSQPIVHCSRPNAEGVRRLSLSALQQPEEVGLPTAVLQELRCHVNGGAYEREYEVLHWHSVRRRQRHLLANALPQGDLRQGPEVCWDLQDWELPVRGTY